MSHCFRCTKPMKSGNKFELARPSHFHMAGWDFCSLRCIHLILAREDHEIIPALGNSDHRCETCGSRLQNHPFNKNCLPTPCVRISRFRTGHSNVYHCFCCDRCCVAWLEKKSQPVRS